MLDTKELRQQKTSQPPIKSVLIIFETRDQKNKIMVIMSFRLFEKGAFGGQATAGPCYDIFCRSCSGLLCQPQTEHELSTVKCATQPDKNQQRD